MLSFARFCRASRVAKTAVSGEINHILRRWVSTTAVEADASVETNTPVKRDKRYSPVPTLRRLPGAWASRVSPTNPFGLSDFELYRIREFPPEKRLASIEKILVRRRAHEIFYSDLERRILYLRMTLGQETSEEAMEIFKAYADDVRKWSIEYAEEIRLSYIMRKRIRREKNREKKRKELENARQIPEM